MNNNIILYKKQIDYLKSNKFTPHVYGNSYNYGLNFLGANPVIQYKNDLWIFIHWESGSDIANFINSLGEIFSFNSYNKSLDIERMDLI